MSNLKTEGLLHKVLMEHDFQGAALVACAGEKVFEAACGIANQEWDIRNTVDTKFIIASLTKQFTSMLIMLLQEQGKLDLEGRLGSYLPWYRRDTGQKVTVHHLLSHTSGIPSYTDLSGFMETALRQSFSPKQFVQRYCSGDLLFEPGTEYRYNNSGYYLLGAIIEEITGMTYEAALSELILKPLGLTDTGYYRPEQIIAKRADGYLPTAEGYEKAPFIDSSVIYAAGAMYSTVRDLFAWDQALYQHKLVSKQTTERIFTPVRSNYGYGWGVAQVAVPEVRAFLANPADFRTGDLPHSHMLARHEGGHPGYHSLILRVMDERHLVVLLSNYVGFNLGAIAGELLQIICS